MRILDFSLRPDAVKAIFKDNTEYGTFAKLRFDLAMGKVENYTLSQANSVVLTKMREVCGLGENPTAFDVQKALKSTLKREALFDIISETVEDTLVTGWRESPFWDKYVEYKTNRLGQTNRFYVPDTTEIVISEVSSSNHNLTRQRLGAGSEFGVTVRNYAAKVYIEAERYLMGVEDWTGLIDKISLAYTKEINTLLHTSVMDAGNTLPSPTQWNITCQMQKADRSKFVKLLSDVSIATGSAPVIMGTAVALAQLTEMGNIDYLPEVAKEAIYRTGRIGQFDQYQIVEIPQAFAPNDTSKYLVSDAKLLIMPGNIDRFVKFYDEGDMQIKEVSDRNTNYDNTYEYELIRKFGIATLTNTRFGTVTIQA